MRETVDEVLGWCQDQSTHPSIDWTFHCLAMVGAAWDVTPVGSWPNAYDAWTRSDQHPPTENAPAGAPVYWSMWAVGSDGVRRNYGHIAVADEVDGLCWSIDIRRHGMIDRVPITEICTRWGGIYLGWTTDLEGNGPLPLGLPDPQPVPPAPPVGDDDMATPCGFIVCGAGTIGHHIDGSEYACPVDGTVFRVNPGGTIQWVHGDDMDDTVAVMNAAGARVDTWNDGAPVAKPDAFGRLVGDKPH